MSTAAIEQFIRKYQTARSYNSKEIRLTILEAEELSTALALVLSGNNALGARVIELQERLLEKKTELDLSGGKF